MTNRNEAAALLAEARSSEARSSAFFNYRLQAPVMMLWGVIWLLADMTIAYAPQEWLRMQAWTIGGTIGFALTTLYYWRWSGPRKPASRQRFWRFLGTYIFIGIFIACAIAVLAPFDERQPAAFMGLFWAFLYIINGVWTGWRLAALGAAMAGGVLYAFYGLHDSSYLPVMGVICGGGLVLGGFWLRSV